MLEQGARFIRQATTRRVVAWSSAILMLSLLLAPAPASAVAPVALVRSAADFSVSNEVDSTGASLADLTVEPAAPARDAVVGFNRASWDPTITVAVPGGSSAGLYSFTITHSVL
ncbi:hypothetical protein [Cryobacterium sp. Hb1]|uniref:hypothetical protein n=1 Tax=Cryobacterium sp. Hb1 TaxID=1259147 RepID=UPI00106B74E9|nr:hypothetical protein [Cryobacterium sp. Hb1]TFD70203.1 hypothetical protein E3T38_05825 [Cryobacterium sp. Hb1]